MTHIVSVIYINKDNKLGNGYGNFNITEETLRGIMLVGYLIFGPNADGRLIITHKGDVLELFILGGLLYNKLQKASVPVPRYQIVLSLNDKAISHSIPLTSNDFKRGMLQCAEWFGVKIDIR